MILAAANFLAIALLSEWVEITASSLPAFAAGLLVIVAGFVLADFIGDAIERSDVAAADGGADPPTTVRTSSTPTLIFSLRDAESCLPSPQPASAAVNTRLFG